jgi:hypothetical protein
MQFAILPLVSDPEAQFLAARNDVLISMPHQYTLI